MGARTIACRNSHRRLFPRTRLIEQTESARRRDDERRPRAERLRLPSHSLFQGRSDWRSAVHTERARTPFRAARLFSSSRASQYELEIQSDSATYEVASFSPDAHGQLTIDTTLTEFREGECVGKNFDAPRSVSGPHTVKFRIKRAGSPSSGTMPGIAPSAPGAQLSCHGNGDGNYDYLLLENEVANFKGTAAHGDSR